jgi:hypothetical protein
MRCAKRNCQEEAVDGTNYCGDHLAMKGAPRPGLGTGQRSAYTPAKKAAAAKKAPAKKVVGKKATPSKKAVARGVVAKKAPAG